MNAWFGVSPLIFLALGLFAGANLTFQAIVNAQLRTVLLSPLRASFVSYLGGTLCCIVFLLARRESLDIFNVRAINNHAIYWTGGLYGLIYLAITIWLVPRVPLTAIFAVIVAGQLLAALAFDQIGIFGTAVRPIDASKIFGIVLLVAAVYFIRR